MGKRFTKSKHHQHPIMQLIVNFARNQHAVEVSNDSTVEDLKYEIASEYNLEEDSLMMFSQGVELQDEQVFAHLECAELNIETEIKGEGKGGKRKKKVYKTAKRIPHKHVNIKMRALKAYAVQANGDVKFALKKCPQPICKGGIFMGDHWNRIYCGKCHLTLIKENAPAEPPKKKVVAKVEEVVES